MSPPEEEWSARVAEKLGDIRADIDRNRNNSTLPPCIIHNPYLDYQFDYVIKKKMAFVCQYHQ